VESVAEQDSMIGRLKLMVVIALVFAAALGAWAVWGPALKAEPLPVLGQVPAFTLTGLDGKAFDSRSLQGKIWVASFVYTSCKNSCPMLGQQMRRLSKLLPAGDGYALLSVTVDPEKDTPKVLASYAKDLGVDDARWSFLTGKKSVIKDLVENGFKLTAQPGEQVPDERGAPDILHSSELVLVDGQGQIRGYFDGLLGSSVPAIQDQIKRLAKG
jgi:cytochrome oxidase Cu insertion factor (SCO1/SenC/PrrC family)